MSLETVSRTLRGEQLFSAALAIVTSRGYLDLFARYLEAITHGSADSMDHMIREFESTVDRDKDLCFTFVPKYELEHIDLRDPAYHQF